MNCQAIALIAISALSGGAMAQPEPSAPATPAVSPWYAEWRSPFCMVSTGDPKVFAMSIWSVPGSDAVEVYFSGATANVPQLPNGAEVSAQFSPSGDLIPAKIIWTAPWWTGVLELTINGNDFVGKFGRSNKMVVQASGKSLPVGYDDSAEAMSKFQQCLDTVVKTWGVDPAAFATLKVKPEAPPGAWLSYQDYPQDALNANKSGTVVVRLTADETGKVTNCVVVASSGFKSMDKVTCKAALKRAKFKPAIGADGRPTSVTFISYATFRVMPVSGTLAN